MVQAAFSVSVESTIVTAIVSASSAVIVAIVALIVNVVWMGRSFGRLENAVNELRQDAREIRGDIKLILNKLGAASRLTDSPPS